MKKMMKAIFTALVATMLFAGSSFALDFDYTGHLPYHNSVLQYSFTANGTSPVTLFSSSWDEGNFDPMLGLWKSDGSLVQWQDDGGLNGSTLSNGISYSHGGWDSYFTNILTAGSYFVTLSTYYNAPVSNNLSGGFSYDSQTPVQISQWVQPANGMRGDYFEFHITGVESAHDDSGNNNNPVPEPSTMLLLGGGLAGLAFWRKKKNA